MFTKGIKEVTAMRIGTYILLAIACLALVPAAPVHAEQFEGTIVQLDPVLQVKSLKGEVRQFHPLEQKAGPVKIRLGDFVRLAYDAGPSGVNTLSEITVRGGTLEGTVIEIAADKSWFVVRTQQPDNSENNANVSLQASKEFQPLVTAMQPGDRIRAIYVLDEEISSVQSLEWQSMPLGRAACWIWLIIALLALLGGAFLFTKGHPASLYLGADNRYSNSKFQTVLWFWMVISAYCAIVSHRIWASGGSYIGGVNIPQNLLVLSGISVLTFAAAKAITVGKVEQAAAKGENAKPAALAAAQHGDLITDDLNRTDLGDFQMVAITFLAAILYAIAVVEFMQRLEFRSVITMPDVNSTLLAIFGLGQAAYLGKKWAGDAPGMTSDQAVKAAADAADAAKEEAVKAATARKTAQTKETEAKDAAKAVNAAADKAAKQTEFEKAQSAADAARAAANAAAAAAQTAEARAADAQKLAGDWSKVTTAAVSTKSSSDNAQGYAATAKQDATDADTAAISAKKEAENAAAQVSPKP